EARGVTLQPAEGGMLRVRPSLALTPEEREAARALKREILDLLSRRPTADPWPAELGGHGRHIGPQGRCAACRAATWVSYAAVPICLPCATVRGTALVDYRRALERCWDVGAACPTADPSECLALDQEIARSCDDVGEPLATRLRLEWARAYWERTAICPFCGERGSYHDPRHREGSLE